MRTNERVTLSTQAIICLLLVALLVISPLLLTDHDCSCEQCVLCLLSSGIKSGIACFATFGFILLVLSSHYGTHREGVKKTETLVDLKRKLTI